MLPLPLLAAFLVVAPPSAAQSGTPLEQARAAFESAAPITPELRRAVARSTDAEELGKSLDEIAALETAKNTDGSDAQALDALARRVNEVSDALKVDGEARRAAALNLYVTRWQSRRAGLTPAQAAQERSFAQARLGAALSAQSGAQGRVTARLRDLSAFQTNGPGGVGTGAAARIAAAGAVAAAGPSGAALINSTGRPQGLHTDAVPSPTGGSTSAAETGTCPKDGTLATMFNLEKCSMKGTPNRESAEGTKAKICTYLKKADYNPAKAYDLALAARRRPDADPGDLDLRNTEHYLYAYTSASNPVTIGDSAPVQVILAIGWTPFKTITKYVRPTSTPSMEEMEWGVKGAVNAVSRPDWRSECGGSVPRATSA